MGNLTYFAFGPFLEVIIYLLASEDQGDFLDRMDCILTTSYMLSPECQEARGAAA